MCGFCRLQFGCSPLCERYGDCSRPLEPYCSVRIRARYLAKTYRVARCTFQYGIRQYASQNASTAGYDIQNTTLEISPPLCYSAFTCWSMLTRNRHLKNYFPPFGKVRFLLLASFLVRRDSCFFFLFTFLSRISIHLVLIYSRFSFYRSLGRVP